MSPACHDVCPFLCGFVDGFACYFYFLPGCQGIPGKMVDVKNQNLGAIVHVVGSLLDIPFFNQSYFGDANSSRGHYWAQWIDNDLTFAMFELRWHMWKIIDATVFYDVGRVWEDMYDKDEWQHMTVGELHSAYGFGMRFNMVPAMMMRIDYGFSKENPGGLLYIYGWHTF